MKNSQSNTDKNFKAKLNNDSSLIPNYWLYAGIIAILTCLGFYGYRYWQLSSLTPQSDIQTNLKPPNSSDEINSSNSNTITKEELSSEDLSIAADLDNIDVILQEMEENVDRENFIPIKNIPKKKKDALDPTKFSSKIKSDSDLKSSQTEEGQSVKMPSLNQTLNNSSIQKVIQPSSATNQIGLTSNNSKQTINNNLINSNPEARDENLSPLGRMYDRSGNLQQQDSVNNNSSLVNIPETGRSPSNLEQPTIFLPESIVTATQSPRNLSDYQIQPQNYNRLVPSNYLALPRTNSQLTSIPNNGSSIMRTSAAPLNDLSSYQLQLQELNQFNLGTSSLNTPNTNNLSQSNGSSTITNPATLNNSGLQPSGILQPSGSIIVDN